MEWIVIGLLVGMVLQALANLAEPREDAAPGHPQPEPDHRRSPGAEACYYAVHNHGKIRHGHYMPIRENYHIHDAAGTMHPVTPTEDGYIFTNSLGHEVEVIEER